MLYAFKLGRNKELSIAEIAAIFTEKKIEQLINDQLIVHTGEILDTDSINRLGGTIKISQIIDECDKTNLVSKISELILKNRESDTKLTYAINIEPESKNAKRFLKNLLTDVKKNLKTAGVKPRFLNKFSRDGAENIENIQSKKEILDKENSIEINLLKNSEQTYLLARLVASQDIEKYSKRDFSRPHRDTVNGILPPKLAQILINLSLANNHNSDPKNTMIIDPFCGSGGLLMEAMLMGFHVVGSDINPVMISHSKENIEWTRRNFGIHRNQDSIIFAHDATQRFPKAKKTTIIATEGFLGDPMTHFPDEETMQKNFSHIKSLYADFFKNLSHMHETATVAICIPNYLKNREAHEPKGLIDKIKSLGFTQRPLISSNLNAKLGNAKHDTLTLLYSRDDQIVGRRICVFQK